LADKYVLAFIFLKAFVDASLHHPSSKYGLAHKVIGLKIELFLSLVPSAADA